MGPATLKSETHRQKGSGWHGEAGGNGEESLGWVSLIAWEAVAFFDTEQVKGRLPGNMLNQKFLMADVDADMHILI